MKKFMFMCMLLAVVAVSCKDEEPDDDTPAVKKNAFTVNGTEYLLTQAALVYGGEENPGEHWFSVYCLSSGVTIYGTPPVIDSAGGAGNYLGFEILATSSTEIPSGNYPKGNDTLLVVNKNYGGAYGIGYNWSTGTGGTTKEITINSIAVLKTGTTYEISFNATDEDNKAITFYYKGVFTYWID